MGGDQRRNWAGLTVTDKYLTSGADENIKKAMHIFCFNYLKVQALIKVWCIYIMANVSAYISDLFCAMVTFFTEKLFVLIVIQFEASNPNN